jgi:hypothetical protein
MYEKGNRMSWYGHPWHQAPQISSLILGDHLATVHQERHRVAKENIPTPRPNDERCSFTLAGLCRYSSRRFSQRRELKIRHRLNLGTVLVIVARNCQTGRKRAEPPIRSLALASV